MSLQVQIILRTRKLGVLIRDARVAARKNTVEVANAAGISPALLRAYEEGRKAPSLPELELLAYYFRLPIKHFWSDEALSNDASRTEPVNLSQLAALRQRILGALLRQKRQQAGIPLKSLALETGISQRRINGYEQGESTIPLPELEALLSVIGAGMDGFFDHSSPAGKWMHDQAAIQEFSRLSPELQEFVSTPVNRPYLELARKLSQLSTDKLRSVAESLLDITL